MSEPTSLVQGADSLRAEISKMSGDDLAGYADALASTTHNTPGQMVRNVLVWEEIAKRLRKAK